MAENKIFLRVKRRNQTICLLCHEGSTVEAVQRQIREVSEQHNFATGADPRMRLLKAGNILDENETLQSLGLKDDDELHLVFAISDSEYEQIDIVSTAAVQD